VAVQLCLSSYVRSVNAALSLLRKINLIVKSEVLVLACDVSGGDVKSAPSAAFFKDLEQRCPNLRRLHLSKVDVTAPLPASLEFLSLSESSLSPTALSAFLFDAGEGQTVTSRLREVELVSVELRRSAMAAVPSSVERLRIRDTELPRESFEGLAGGQATVSRLKEIDLSDNTRLTDVEIDNITSAWPHINTLKLNGCVNTTFPSFTVFLHIVQSLGQGGRLEILEANGVQFTYENIRYMCTHLGGSLRRLSVAGCKVPGGLTDVANLPNLRSLDVSGSGCSIMFGGVGYVLEALEANGLPLADVHIRIICQNLAPTLRRLGIARCWLTKSGATTIASTMTNLQSLDISGCPALDDADFMVFASLGETLHFLNLSATKVSKDTVDLLKVALPNCEIVH